MTQLIAFAACLACLVPLLAGSAAAYQGSASSLDESDRTGATNPTGARHCRNSHRAETERPKEYVRDPFLEIFGGFPKYKGR